MWGRGPAQRKQSLKKDILYFVLYLEGSVQYVRMKSEWLAVLHCTVPLPLWQAVLQCTVPEVCMPSYTVLQCTDT
jgi:hypothetical protein